MTKVFHFYTDPGHGWCKVPVSVLDSLGVTQQVSGYSYRRGDFGYLEEDCDMGLFWKAFIAKHGEEPKLVTHYADRYSKIRRYPRFSPL